MMEGWTGRVCNNIYYYTPDFIFLIYLQGKSHLLVFILVGVAVAAVVVAAAVVGVFVYQKRNGEWIKLSRRTNT